MSRASLTALCVCSMIESGNIQAAFMSSLHVFESTCASVRLVQCYEAAVLSYRLVLRLAETFHAALMKQVLTCVLHWFVP